MHVKSVSVVKHVRYNVPPPIQCNVNWNNEWEVGLYNEVVDAVEVRKSTEKNFQESPTFFASIVDRCDQLSFLIGTPILAEPHRSVFKKIMTCVVSS